MSVPSRSLPPHPSLEQQKTQAKELLKSLRAGDAGARERVLRHLPDKRRITLADAQFVTAREYGFESWARLKAHIELAAAGRARALDANVLDELRRAFHARDAAAARALFERHPAARAMIDAPLFSFASPALAHIAGEEHLAMVEVLLDFGADPNRRSDWWPAAFTRCIRRAARWPIA